MKKIFAWKVQYGLILLLFLSAMTVFLPKEQLSDRIRVGSSDDLSGFVLHHMLHNNDSRIQEQLEPYIIHDC